MEFIEILKRCTVEGNIVRLPGIYIDRWCFNEVKRKLEALGGKWHFGEEVNGFVFNNTDAAEALKTAQEPINKNKR